MCIDNEIEKLTFKKQKDMKKLVLILLALLLMVGNAVTAQNRYQSILDSIGRNSLTFKVLEKKYDAESAAIYRGSLVKNPELKYGYNWTAGADVQPSMSLSLTQTIDFPMTYVSQNMVRNLQSNAAMLNMNLNQTVLLLEVQHVCAELVYSNAVVALYERCVANAEDIAKIYKTRVATGDCNVLDYNRASMDLAESQNKLNVAIAERDILLASLQVLNGGKQIDFIQQKYDDVNLSMNFDLWFEKAEENSPKLQCIVNDMDLAQNEVRLARRMWGPELKFGVSSGLPQEVGGSVSQGASLAVILPLWKNARAVRAAKARTYAVQAQFDDERVKLYNQMKALYKKSIALQENVMNLQRAFETYNSVELLRKALESGELSLEYYLISIDFYYDAELSILESQRKLESAVLDLNAPLLVVNRE